MKKIFVLSFLLITTLCANAQSVFLGFNQAQTEHFRFIYEDSAKEVTEGFALYADEAWEKIGKIYAYPQDKTDVVVINNTNTVNAYAEGIQFSIGMYSNPYITSEFGFRDNWQKLFFTHELVHIAHMNFESKPNYVSKVFGSFLNYFNFSSLPGWMLEGLTTVLETELTNGGRGRSPFFELMYKAPTIENSFISFDEIGASQEPPQGQIYVMGYLICRSIADRFGVQALADIERNRSYFGNDWNAATKLVTGLTPDEIYKDVKIALAKKFSQERLIPEGQTITPRTTNAYYYKPALINSDGTMIMLRSYPNEDLAVVKYNPYATDIEKDKKETVLFSGYFPDATSVTAAENDTVVAVMQTVKTSRFPGATVTNDLYLYTKEAGVKQLTKNQSFFQPTLSRDGNTLVAVELHGLKNRLVMIDLSSGEKRVLLESSSLDFIQPALNADGTKLAFLVLNDIRASLAYMDMPKFESLEKMETVESDIENSNNLIFYYVANTTGDIIDIAYPSWNSNGNITYASNERGRLEVYEFDGEKSDPVVSDPVGVIYAYQGKEGIYYSSYAATGYVVKIKPLDEWKIVPEFAGPSEPGTIMTFGHLQNDYVDFKPFVTSENQEILAKQREKDFIPRSEEFLQKAEGSGIVLTELQNERRYFDLPSLLLWMPTVSFLSINETEYSAFGAFSVFKGMSFQANTNISIYELDFSYLPEINQYLADIVFYKQMGSFLNYFFINHTLGETESKNFLELYNLDYCLSIPFLAWNKYKEAIDLSLNTRVQMDVSNQDIIAFEPRFDDSTQVSLSGYLGAIFSYENFTNDSFVLGIDSSLSALCNYPFLDDVYNQCFFGCEYEADFLLGVKSVQAELALFGRYLDMPVVQSVTKSIVDRHGTYLSYEYPGRTICRLAIVLPDELFKSGLTFNTFAEKLVSFGDSKYNIVSEESTMNMTQLFDSFYVSNDLIVGAELRYKSGLSNITFQASWELNEEPFKWEEFSFSVDLRISGFKL